MNQLDINNQKLNPQQIIAQAYDIKVDYDIKTAQICCKCGRAPNANVPYF